MLLTRNDFIIVDFEGEPGHSLEHRRAKYSPLRDVAGMLRSFAYVEHSALRTAAHNEVEIARLAPLARGWAVEVRAAFLSAYDAKARDGALYGSLEPGRGLLGLFELEKALYELRYELGNRPGWAGIPLQGILDMGAGGAHGLCTRLLETAREFPHQIAALLPRLALALAILVAGWLFAKAARFTVEKALRAINFNVLTERAGTDHFLQQGGLRGDTTTLFGLFAYWLVILVALIDAFNTLGLTYITDLLHRVVLFMPKVLVRCWSRFSAPTLHVSSAAPSPLIA